MRPLAIFGALAIPLASFAACDDPGETRDLEAFRGEIGNQTHARLVIARMYQHDEWMIREVADASPDKKIAYVCDEIARLKPTYVSGLVRLDESDKITQEMLDIYDGVKKCIRKQVDHKVRFDVVLNALQYTSEDPKVGGIDSKKEGLELLKARVKSADALAPDGYFFDFFSEPWKGAEGPWHRDALVEGIAWIQARGAFVGGNVKKGIIPEGTDFVALADTGGPDEVRHQMDLLRGGKAEPPVPVLLHIRNDPHIEGSEGRRYIEGTTKYRKRVIRRHVGLQSEGLTYMYPVFFPLYPPSDAHAFDAGQDGTLLDRMRDHLGPVKDPADHAKLPAVSDEDAEFTPYDTKDLGLIAIHRAVSPDLQHVYAVSPYELEDSAEAPTVEYEDYFALARDQADSTAPLHRCDLGGGAHLYTTDAACEGHGIVGVPLGFIAITPVDAAVPLHRLRRGDGSDFLFTTSALERDAAIADGYVHEGIAGHVWDEVGYAVADAPDEPTDPPDPMDPPPPAACDAPLVPIYVGFHEVRKQHLFATNRDELNVPNMTDQGVAFQLKPSPPPDARWVPFFRCLLPNSWHLLTVDPGCEGAASAVNEGTLGNISTAPLTGTAKLFRYFHSDPGGKNDHFFKIGTACETIAGYTCASAAGYVCPP